MENNNNSSNTYTQPTYNKPKEKDFKPYIACESECKMNRDNSYIDCSILWSEGDGFMRGSHRTTCERNIQTKFHQFIKAIIKT